MLRSDGLCDLICALGEEALCQICADHPRYRSFFTDRTEIGLGLCCEAAALLVLGWEKPTSLLTLEDDGENEEPDEEEAWLLALRAELISLLQQRETPLQRRLARMAELYPLPEWTDEQWRSLLRGLERLDPAWDDVLDRASLHEQPAHDPALDTAMEQLGVYLLYRHLPGALEDGDAEGRVKLALLGVRLISGLCAAHQRQWGRCTLEDCAEYARMFSAEIEYSEDNIAALLEALEEE
jgi:lysine-N-methylase